MIDAHAHLSDERLYGAVGEVLERARKAGVTRVLMAGTEPSDWERQRSIASAHDGALMAFGLHPWRAVSEGAVRRALERLNQEVQRQPTPAAIGETGLDRSPRHKPTLPHQEFSLREHLRIAVRRDLPVILHVVRAHGRMLEILRALDAPPAGLVHGFDGSPEVAREYQALGFHISVGGRVCSPDAHRLRRAVTAIDAQRMLIETDTPDQMPHGLEPGRNEPASLLRIAETVAELRGESVEQVGALTAENARRLLGLST